MKKTIIVIPCYNEEEVLRETAKRLKLKVEDLIKSGKITIDSQILFVDDGSKDKTWDIIKELYNEHQYVIGIKLSRNCGHQNALIAGLMAAKDMGEIIISMDADLQDDINAIDDFIDANENGYEIVYGVRKKRANDSFFKRTTAEMFYHLMKILGVDVVFNHADYRLMSRRALDNLAEFKEVNLFLRGIVPLIGLNSTTVFYDRDKRYAGQSKYPFIKMLNFAFEGITSFSIKPIRMIFSVGVIMLFTSITMIIYTLYRYFTGETVSGWAFLNISIWFIAGIQAFLLGVVGEYVGKTYSESKHRPRYIIETKLID